MVLNRVLGGGGGTLQSRCLGDEFTQSRANVNYVVFPKVGFGAAQQQVTCKVNNSNCVENVCPHCLSSIKSSFHS